MEYDALDLHRTGEMFQLPKDSWQDDERGDFLIMKTMTPNQRWQILGTSQVPETVLIARMHYLF